MGEPGQALSSRALNLDLSRAPQTKHLVTASACLGVTQRGGGRWGAWQDKLSTGVT